MLLHQIIIPRENMPTLFSLYMAVDEEKKSQPLPLDFSAYLGRLLGGNSNKYFLQVVINHFTLSKN